MLETGSAITQQPAFSKVLNPERWDSISRNKSYQKIGFFIFLDIHKGALMKALSLFTYFQKERKTLAIVTITGIIYNIGLIAGPYFEGKMVGCLYEILTNQAPSSRMLQLVLAYLCTIFIVQISRFLKRNYVRIFANNTNRTMKHTLYHHLLQISQAQMQSEGIGNILTKALNDVDDCSEGMRKFTTEIFDTGIALCAYITMLFSYDAKLALLCLIFTPFSYLFAEKMKTIIQANNKHYKQVSAKLAEETLDRANNAITYRVYGIEQQRKAAYENVLDNYEKAYIRASLPSSAMPPLYTLVSLCGVFCIVYFGSQNIYAHVWDIASFTTFLSCFMKMSEKAGKSAKLFNAVHKAQVSWNRIKSYMIDEKPFQYLPSKTIHTIQFHNISFHYPASAILFSHITFSAHVGEIIGITGHVACGKSTLGKLLLNELSYEGSITIDNQPLSSMENTISYFGHETQLFNDTIQNNIALGDDIDIHKYLRLVCLDEDVGNFPNGINTIIGENASLLSGGQAQRLALARTLAHAKSILLLDDPFSSLDKITEEKIFNNLKQTYNDKIILLISHRLYQFPQMDHILFMHDHTATYASHNQLMQENQSYRNLFLGGETHA